MTARHITLPVTLYTREGNGVRTSALVDCGAISNYVSPVLFCSLGTPITCSSSAPIMNADGHVIFPKVEETTIRCHFSLVDSNTEERFTVAPTRHSLMLGMPRFVRFNP
jgi:predicted aspartyl protease